MTKYLSDKLTVLYTILIIMVVYIHSYYLESEQYVVSHFIQKFIGHGICQIANCLFFCISGYLFVRNINGINDIWPKLKKKVRTLVLPYVLWNLVFVLWYIIIERKPYANQFNNGTGTLERYLNQPITDSLYSLFLAPAAFQLWFLRDLIVMSVCVPLLWWLTKKSWVIALLIAFFSVSFYPWLLYFWIGIILSVKKCKIENYSCPVWIFILGVFIYLFYAIYAAYGNVVNRFVMAFINIVCLYVIWNLYDIFAHGKCLKNKGIFKYICGYSFFIYCFHEPTFNIIKKLALAICGVSGFTVTLFYLLNPWIMVFVSVFVAKLLNRFTPRVYAILTGGR